MAADFLSSSHRRWIFPKEELASRIEQNRPGGDTREEAETVALLPSIAVHVPCVSSRVVCTASILFKRFVVSSAALSARSALCALLACVFVTLKNEECDDSPSLNTFATQFAAAHEKVGLPVILPEEIRAAEKRVLGALNFEIVVHPAHVFLETIAVDVALSGENFGKAHALLMTSLRTDAHLLFTPHLIAMSCVFLAVFQSQPGVVDALFRRLQLSRKLLEEFLCELGNA